MWLCAVGPTFFRSAARGLHAPAARRKASRCPSRGSGGPANGRASAAAKSWAAVRTSCCLPRFDVDADRVKCCDRLALLFCRLEAPLTYCFEDVRYERIVLAADDAKVTHVAAGGDYAFENDDGSLATNFP